MTLSATDDAKRPSAQAHAATAAVAEIEGAGARYILRRHRRDLAGVAVTTAAALTLRPRRLRTANARAASTRSRSRATYRACRREPRAGRQHQSIGAPSA